MLGPVVVVILTGNPVTSRVFVVNGDAKEGGSGFFCCSIANNRCRLASLCSLVTRAAGEELGVLETPVVLIGGRPLGLGAGVGFSGSTLLSLLLSLLRRLYRTGVVILHFYDFMISA